jgi:hypothetical protein
MTFFSLSSSEALIEGLAYIDISRIRELHVEAKLL